MQTDNEGSVLLRNVVTYLPNHMAWHAWRPYTVVTKVASVQHLFFWQRDTPVIAGWLAGRACKNNNKL